MVGGNRPLQAGEGSAEVVIASTTGRQIAAGAFVALVLLTAADFEPTSSIAVAFAYLILLAALMTIGPVAFDRITTLVTGKKGSA